MNNHQQKHGLSQSWAEPVLLVAALALFLLTMPAFLYPGDSYMSRAEAEWLLRSGRWGIPVERVDETLVEYLEVPGQYAVYRPRKNDYVSKFGVAYTLLSLIPVQIVLLLRDAVDFQDPGRLTAVVFALYQGVLLAIGLLYLFRFVRRIGAGPWLAAAFCFFSVFATYNWYYLRSTTHEALQWPWALAFFWHLITAVRPDSRISRGHLSAAMFFLLVLVMCRPVYLIWLPVVWIAVFVSGVQKMHSGNAAGMESQPQCVCKIIKQAVRKHWPAEWLLLSGASFLLLLVLLSFQALKFGSPFASGYGVWMTADGVRHDHFGLGYLLDSLPAFWLSLGRSSVWSHYPLLIPAVPGWLLFWRRQRWNAVMILLLSVPMALVIACFSQWHGIFGDGPRYLLPVLPLLSLPAVAAAQAVFAWKKSYLKSLGITFVCMAAILLGALQFNAIILHPLTILNCRLFFNMLQIENVERYFDRLPHPGLHTRDLMRYSVASQGYYPMDKLRQRREPGDEHMFHIAIDVLEGMLLPDLMLYNPPPWESVDQIVAREMGTLPHSLQTE